MMKQANKNILNVPKLRFPEFRDAGEWKDKLLGDIGKVSMCKRIMKRETSESGYIPFYKIGTFGKKADAYISKELYDLYRKKFSFPKKSDILISASGTIGRTVVYDGKPAYFQDSNIIWIDNDENIVSNLFLAFVYQIVKWMTDNNTIARLYNDNLRKIEITIPSPSEQQKIADCLTSLDDIIAAQNQKLNILKTHKKGLMQNLFPANGKTTPKLRFPEFENAPAWRWERLYNICKKQSSNLSANSLTKTKGNEKYKVYGASGYIQNVDFYKQEDQYISIVKDGSGVGRTRLCEAKTSVLGTLDIITTKGENNLKFLHILIDKIHFNRYIVGGTIPHIYFRDYSKENVSITNLKEQQKIADCLTLLDDIITAQTKKIDTLKAHKKGLMQQLFP